MAVQNGSRLVDQFGNPILGQYLQYTVNMTTNNSAVTPTLDDISFSWE